MTEEERYLYSSKFIVPLPTHPLGIHIDATGSNVVCICSVWDLKIHEAVNSPVFTPGVLDNEVRCAVALKASSRRGFAAVPPLVDGAYRLGWRSLVFFFFIAQLVTHEGDRVIEACATASSRNDT